ncbi:MAG: thiamine pyrophosphate-dependent enzyme [Thermodesulfovibrionales bacterium]|nr:thiamine pyrophosphate-dependent enzyme [Thermodesulfovibrionales bacterium]
MVRIRLCEESLVEPILKGEIRCPCHLYSGQEAIATGVCAALDEDDYIFGNHRSHGHYLAKGGGMPNLGYYI